MYVPSSCAAERVFSILNDSFDDDQKNHDALADYMELSLQLQFNGRTRSRLRLDSDLGRNMISRLVRNGPGPPGAVSTTT